MQQIADTGIFENLKEKIASPLLFSYFCVFCSWNIEHILYLFYMPLKIDKRWDDLYAEWSVWWPILITLILVAVLPWLNNVVEIWKRIAHKHLQDYLTRKELQTPVSYDKHQKVLDQLSQANIDLSNLQDINERATSNAESKGVIIKKQNTQIEELKYELKDKSTFCEYFDAVHNKISTHNIKGLSLQSRLPSLKRKTSTFKDYVDKSVLIMPEAKEEILRFIGDAIMLQEHLGKSVDLQSEIEIFLDTYINDTGLQGDKPKLDFS